MEIQGRDGDGALAFADHFFGVWRELELATRRHVICDYSLSHSQVGEHGMCLEAGAETVGHRSTETSLRFISIAWKATLSETL